MRTIVIILGDNDFGNTFRPLLETINSAIVWNGGLSREVVEKAIRVGIEFHYTVFQHGRHYGEEGYSTIDKTVKYLEKIKVLFDEEAENDILTQNRDGGAWYLEVITGKVYAY